jgi:tRNA A-37 threonylcarbamoyl transferase component Bud32
VEEIQKSGKFLPHSKPEVSKVIQRGAEAVIIKSGGSVVKRRVKKGYRLEELDLKLRRRRTRSEGKLLVKASRMIKVPVVQKVDDREMEIEMEFISGLKLSENLDSLDNWKEVCGKIGESIGKLHDSDIIHGDLTTSNMIWVSSGARPTRDHVRNGNGDDSDAIRSPTQKSAKKDNGKSGHLYFIDFGLGYGNGRTEDKAVDLHLIKQALEAKHFSRFEDYWKGILEGYSGSEGSEKVLKQLEKVERRGRYKSQY